jgi:hypothetical protein
LHLSNKELHYFPIYLIDFCILSYKCIFVSLSYYHLLTFPL